MTFLDTKVALITLGFAMATLLVLASLLFLIPSMENFTKKKPDVVVRMIVEDGTYGLQGPEWETLRSTFEGNVRFVVLKASDPEAARAMVQDESRVPDLRIMRGGKSVSRYVGGAWSAESMKAWIQGALGQ